MAQDIQHGLRLDVYGRVQRLDMAYFETQRTGNLMSILNDDINQLERFLNGGANSIIQVLCSSVMVSAVFFALQPGIAVIALLPVPAILVCAFWFQKRLAPRYTEVREAAGDVSARLNNNLLGLATFKAFATETFEAQHIEQGSNAYRSRNRTTIVIAHRLSTVRQADCIHLLEGGRIVESGTHDTLLARNGGYAALWRLQTGERSDADKGV
ncbi:MAG: hypothetical protein K9J77_06655 [Rhodoferax sp.]|nr:hypothetical protein [Rhodoferax sp.]